MSDETRMTFDRYTQLVGDILGVPAAIVSILGEHGQTFPGAFGLPEPWQTQRWTPLVHSVCLLVVQNEAPVAVPDARLDDRTSHNPSISELHLVAYLGVPLRSQGEVVGAMCAIDDSPREWTDRDTHLLTGLAAACSAELTLRASRAQARARQQEAESARNIAERDGHDARVAQQRSERRRQAVQESERHSRLLLSMSESLTATTTVDSVIEVVQHAAISYLGATTARFELDGFPLLIDAGTDDGQRSLPVPLSGGLPGHLTLSWATPEEARRWIGSNGTVNRIEETVAALAHYASTALDRAILLQERRSAAATLQHAMLTTLPTRPDMELEARYVPAASANQVGGDWYDAVVIEDPAGTAAETPVEALVEAPAEIPAEALAVVIGDVAGHDIEAAATMGQVRSILRGLLVDSPRPPAQMIGRLDAALARLGMPTASSLVLAVLHRHPDDPQAYRLSWANAGHPHPLLVRANGDAELLTGEPDLLLGIPYEMSRSTRHVDLWPGDTLILYTDGLVQRHGRRLAEGQERLMESAAAHHLLPLGESLDNVLQDLITNAPDDDCAVLAVRLLPF
ncbi:SpoIIE family protein phosphatase [Kineosporia sp. J2-2]|uniref:SpoIIE family protein phosphatase n=1 Tax=Kineosporia corallincola TaxID=2835133 RepID=A0ABS5T9R5_9ACTN|nr:GAF domain-containing SpoIIE family protein phosphatase [Kineosporia corallincola]MBT0767812.1 SpoIIE family protein phosphatase [Kineosporia corallincola]